MIREPSTKTIINNVSSQWLPSIFQLKSLTYTFFSSASEEKSHQNKVCAMELYLSRWQNMFQLFGIFNCMFILATKTKIITNDNCLPATWGETFTIVLHKTFLPLCSLLWNMFKSQPLHRIFSKSQEQTPETTMAMRTPTASEPDTNFLRCIRNPWE